MSNRELANNKQHFITSLTFVNRSYLYQNETRLGPKLSQYLARLPSDRIIYSQPDGGRIEAGLPDKLEFIERTGITLLYSDRKLRGRVRSSYVRLRAKVEDSCYLMMMY